MMLAKYLSGTNAAGAPITWPAFKGSSSAGFAGKYTPRQIDSIVAQICNLGAEAVSPDYPLRWDPLWVMVRSTRVSTSSRRMGRQRRCCFPAG